MFNTALTYTAIRNFQKNLSKPIDKENQKVYNNNEDKERGNNKMKKLKVIEIINLLMERKIEKSDIFFYVCDVGYLVVDEIYLEDDGIEVHNCEVDIKEEFIFTDELYLI